MTYILRITSMFFMMVNPLIAAIHHHDFKGVSDTIAQDISPVRGKILLMTLGISNIRFFMENSEDPYFKLVKMLFPSNGGTLATTAQTTYNFGKSCTSPATAAELILFAQNIAQKRTYSFLKREELVAKLAKDSHLQKAELKKYKKLTLAPLLLAIEDVINAHESIKTFYQGISVTDIIHAFFCFHFNTKNDLIQYIKAINGKHLTEERFSIGEFDAIKFKDNPTLEEQLFVILSDLSEKSPYPRGEVLISNDNCPAFDRSTGHYIEKKFFADCVETALRHFLNILFFDGSSRSFILDHIEPKYRSSFFDAVEEFYAWQPEEKANDGSRDLRGLFNKITGDLNDNNYIISYRDENKNNIKSGLINFINVLNRIFNLEIDIGSLSDNTIDQALETILMALCRHENYYLQAENLTSTKNELYGELVLDMGGEDTFIIEISPYHTETKLTLASIEDEDCHNQNQHSQELIRIFMSDLEHQPSEIMKKLSDNDAKIFALARLLHEGPDAWGEHQDLIKIYLGNLLSSLSWNDDHTQELFECYIAPLFNEMSIQHHDIAAYLLGFVEYASFAYSKGLDVTLLPLLHGLKRLIIEDGELLESIFIDGRHYHQLEEIKLGTDSDSIVAISHFNGILRFMGNIASSVSLSNCKLKELKAHNLSIKNGKALLYNVAISKTLSCDNDFIDINDPQLDLSALKNAILSSENSLHIPVLPALKKLEITIKMPCARKEPLISFGNGVFEHLKNIMVALEHPWVRCKKPQFSMYLDSRHMPALQGVKNQNIYPKHFSWANAGKIKELPCCDEITLLGDNVCDITITNTPGNFSFTISDAGQLVAKSLKLLKMDDSDTTVDLSAFKKISAVEIVGGGVIKNLTIVGLNDYDTIYCTSIKQSGDSMESIIIKNAPQEIHEKLKDALLKNRFLSPRQIIFMNEPHDTH